MSTATQFKAGRMARMAGPLAGLLGPAGLAGRGSAAIGQRPVTSEACYD